jgi:hypothetical protein
MSSGALWEDAYTLVRSSGRIADTVRLFTNGKSCHLERWAAIIPLNKRPQIACGVVYRKILGKILGVVLAGSVGQWRGLFREVTGLAVFRALFD